MSLKAQKGAGKELEALPDRGFGVSVGLCRLHRGMIIIVSGHFVDAFNNRPMAVLTRFLPGKADVTWRPQSQHLCCHINAAALCLIGWVPKTSIQLMHSSGDMVIVYSLEIRSR